ncbi:aminopeptidase [Clostridium tarantellae]|uniref:Aminopeptidase n=1 Tax=Clostridium tarantellae TaxID=39493 RepID=A0A6I1MPK1_9CLOT|nr:aminopeptidase [Clostridium tarantellae]MPQ42219.1 aminopeptidase [Clostridium tarantellae]
MNIKENFLRKYAKLAVHIGVNVQPNQTLVISSPIECADFTRLAVEEAYLKGAKEVVVQWNDEITSKLKYIYSPIEIFENIPEWIKESRLSYAREGACFLSISASDPELLKDVDPNKIATFRKASSLSSKEFSDRLMSNENSWSIVSIPTIGWAKKVFPNVSEDIAVEKLWNEIFKIVRIDKEDPVKAWNEHTENLRNNMNFLNNQNLKSVHFKNALGTDLIIELVNNHLWVGGAEKTKDGIDFIANMPTEEVFTMPKKTGVNGIVYSSKPLNYAGNLIDNFSLTFKDGKVIDFSAKKGYDTLKHILDTDEGAKYLGEVALVPFNSPISNSGIIFFNTLYDENASCHLALGKAYSSCIENGENLSKEDLKNLGSNDSLTHVDFMIGTSDLSITGLTMDGKEIKIFNEGNWSF